MGLGRFQDTRASGMLIVGTSLVVQWLGLCASTARGMGSIPGPGTKIPQAARCSQKKLRKKRNVHCQDKVTWPFHVWIHAQQK